MSSRTPRNLILAGTTFLALHLATQSIRLLAQEGPPPPPPPALNLTAVDRETLTVAEVAHSLEGPGVSIDSESIRFRGNVQALGTFRGGTGILGDNFESGIVLSSGKVVDAVGPNKLPYTQTNFALGGDDDLSTIVGTMTFDAAVLEFDVIPTSSQVQFKYVFTSEEYNEFANSAFNNVFAFLVGDSENKVNCAVLPDGAAVSINNINLVNHPAFFRNNEGTFVNGTFVGAPINIEADGLTTELTCTANVTPHERNHFKLAIADTFDHIYDSWVFIKAETLSVSETVPPDCCVPEPGFEAEVIVNEFTADGGANQTQQFSFEDLGLKDLDRLVLQVTQKETKQDFSLNATATLHTPDELDPSLKNPKEFPPDTKCVRSKTEAEEDVCIDLKVVDAATGEFPDERLYEGPIKWEFTVNKDDLSRDKAYAIAHFIGNATVLPENIITKLDSGVGESDNYSGIVLTESPIDSVPILRLPFDITVPATAPNPDAALVPFEVGAKGVIIPLDPAFYPIFAELGPDDIQCSPSSHFFPRGTTTVTCMATGDNDQFTIGTFDVTVTDTTAPVLTLPDITVEATGPLTPVSYDDAEVLDPDDGETALNCTPPSGSGFPVGTTPVSCESHDDSGNSATGGFNVTVVDTTAPTLALPADIKVPATSAGGAMVSFNATALDAVSGPAAVTCTPPSGSQFPIGATQVQCTATDLSGNSTTGSFSVTVGCCDVKIAVSPGTARRGQTVMVNISASNFSKKLIYGIIRFEYDSPCGHNAMGAFPAILLPGKKISFSIPFKVPTNACLGTYSLSTTGTFVDGSTTHHSTTLNVVP